ncbi:aminopeptidase P family protein [Microvirga sp. BT689]|uniref:M24 family metallopeptidase n=1 Tax=Microvirga arvi TaxID=2778731 RepID=UPI00194F6F42|nr:Xaa-Pro peptidase family protein [Microvirga arvi]MBM6581891.1 aminopeptidase P family protein [Microvirga arvi]
MGTPSPLDESFYRGVVSRLKDSLQAKDVDALLILDPHNVIYACGFFHSINERPIGLLIPAEGSPRIFAPLLEKENAEANWIGDVETYEEFPGEEHSVAWMIRKSGFTRIAVDALSADLYERLQAVTTRLVLTDIVERLRYLKTDAELTLVRTAARFADMVLDTILIEAAAIIRRGGTELDILNAGLAYARTAMKRELPESFEATNCGIVGTVHTGPRAALPHGKTLPRRPQARETLIAGIGASVGGYHAESGATFMIGSPDPDQLACLRATDAADREARAALRVGSSCTSVNAVALSAIKEAGYGEYIRHRIGHGMGVQGHEAPWLAPGDDTSVAAGMVFSSEPGIYRPGRDGYRTINTMIVTGAEPEIPSRFQAGTPIEQRIISI